MKPKKLSKQEQALLRCRGVIETVIGQLKEMHHIENTKIRSFEGWIMNILGALTAYQIRAFKPSVKPVIYSDSSLIRNEVCAKPQSEVNISSMENIFSVVLILDIYSALCAHHASYRVQTCLKKSSLTPEKSLLQVNPSCAWFLDSPFFQNTLV